MTNFGCTPHNTAIQLHSTQHNETKHNTPHHGTCPAYRPIVVQEDGSVGKYKDPKYLTTLKILTPTILIILIRAADTLAHIR